MKTMKASRKSKLRRSAGDLGIVALVVAAAIAVLWTLSSQQKISETGASLPGSILVDGLPLKPVKVTDVLWSD